MLPKTQTQYIVLFWFECLTVTGNVIVSVYFLLKTTKLPISEIGCHGFSLEAVRRCCGGFKLALLSIIAVGNVRAVLEDILDTLRIAQVVVSTRRQLTLIVVFAGLAARRDHLIVMCRGSDVGLAARRDHHLIVGGGGVVGRRLAGEDARA